MDLKRYEGMHATIMGLGRFGGGVAAARFLAEHGATVVVTDLREEHELADSLQQLSDVPIARFALGCHPDDVLTSCELLIVNPAVRPDDPLVARAEALQIDVTTEIDLFLRHNSAPVIAVTGSNGKSTTTAMIHHLLIHANPEFTGKIWLGGNIGISLLDRVQEIRENDIVVLELSSFQLHRLRQKKFRPGIAVLTNYSPNHLDWHGSESEYRKAKQGLFDSQTFNDVSIVPNADSATDFASVAPTGNPEWRVRGRKFQFGVEDTGDDGAFLENGMLILRNRNLEDVHRFAVPSHIPGTHNQKNIAAASCAAWIAGANPALFSNALQAFQPLPHRLQLVAERDGRQFWNDSIATTPESAIMALKVFPGRIILLAGGYDKGQDLKGFAEEIAKRATAVILMGQTAQGLRELIARSTSDLPVSIADDFQDAFRRAVAFSQQGDIVLLSPGCASFGWFQDFRERGDLFSAMARDWNPQL